MQTLDSYVCICTCTYPSAFRQLMTCIKTTLYLGAMFKKDNERSVEVLDQFQAVFVIVEEGSEFKG